MNHEPVFEFSEHFDGEYLNALYPDIDEILSIFEGYYNTIPACMEAIREHITTADWEEAGYLAHQLKANLSVIRVTALSEEVHKMVNQIYKIILPSPSADTTAVSFEVSNVRATFHRIQMEVLAHLPFVLAEIDRMRIYLSHPQRRH
nr:Hpt domain-containing protein [uncultured Chitinophaga sp.]